jgi:hypothetical protein
MPTCISPATTTFSVTIAGCRAYGPTRHRATVDIRELRSIATVITRVAFLALRNCDMTVDVSWGDSLCLINYHGDKPIGRPRWNWPARCFWLKDEHLPGGCVFLALQFCVMRQRRHMVCALGHHDSHREYVEADRELITEQDVFGPSETFRSGLYTGLTSSFWLGILKTLQIFRQWCNNVLKGKGKAIPVTGHGGP